MPTHPDPVPVSPAVLQRLARENKEMGQRLAQLEFHKLQEELANPDLFDIQIDFPGDPAPTLVPPLLSEQPISEHLPRLNVTLGKIAWDSTPEKLPVIGIFCPDVESTVLRSALGALLSVHYTQPFARFVFLCETLRPIPFLGRYQLTYEHLGKTRPIDASRRLNLRFGVREIRHLVTGNLLWRAPLEGEG